MRMHRIWIAIAALAGVPVAGWRVLKAGEQSPKPSHIRKQSLWPSDLILNKSRINVLETMTGFPSCSGIASRLAIEHHLAGPPDPDCWPA